jgi:hypothetical protein
MTGDSGVARGGSGVLAGADGGGPASVAGAAAAGTGDGGSAYAPEYAGSAALARGTSGLPA